MKNIPEKDLTSSLGYTVQNMFRGMEKMAEKVLSCQKK